MTIILTSSRRSVYEECHQEMVVFLRSVFDDIQSSYIMYELSSLYNTLISTHIDVLALEYAENNYWMVADFAMTLAENIKRSKANQDNALNRTA